MRDSTSALSADDRRALIGLYVLAPDWAAAREAVEANPWLLSDETGAEFEALASVLVTEGNAAVWAPMLRLASERLAVARAEGPVAAFAIYEDLDQRFRELAGSPSIVEIAEHVRDDPSICGTVALSALRILLLRAITNKADDLERLESLLGLFGRCEREGTAFLFRAAAEQIAEHLRAIPPQPGERANDRRLRARHRLPGGRSRLATTRRAADDSG
jgi:hypothetical protein